MPLHNDEHRGVYGTFEQCSVTGNGTGGFASIFFPASKIEDIPTTLNTLSPNKLKKKWKEAICVNLLIALKKNVIMKERSLNSALVAREWFTNPNSLVFLPKPNEFQNKKVRKPQRNSNQKFSYNQK